MINIEELKNEVENNKMNRSLVIFIVPNTRFVAEMYIRKIASSRGSNIKLVEELDTALKSTDSMFENKSTDDVVVCKCDKLSYHRDGLDNMFIISSSVDGETKELYRDSIVEVPRLQDWQIEEFVKNSLPSVGDNEIHRFLTFHKYDIDKIYQDIQKFEKFPEYDLNNCFSEYVDYLYETNPDITIITFLKAMQTKNVSEIKKHLVTRSSVNIDPIGFLVMMTNSFKRMLQVRCSQNPTEESTGIKANQIWAIKNLPKVFTTTEISNIYKKLLDCDLMVKTGKLKSTEVIDYIVCMVVGGK